MEKRGEIIGFVFLKSKGNEKKNKSILLVKGHNYQDFHWNIMFERNIRSLI